MNHVEKINRKKKGILKIIVSKVFIKNILKNKIQIQNLKSFNLFQKKKKMDSISKISQFSNEDLMPYLALFGIENANFLDEIHDKREAFMNTDDTNEEEKIVSEMVQLIPLEKFMLKILRVLKNKNDETNQTMAEMKAIPLENPLRQIVEEYINLANQGRTKADIQLEKDLAPQASPGEDLAPKGEDSKFMKLLWADTQSYYNPKAIVDDNGFHEYALSPTTVLHYDYDNHRGYVDIPSTQNRFFVNEWFQVSPRVRIFKVNDHPDIRFFRFFA